MNFSVLISVYKNDDALYFDNALESIINQTIKPEQIVLVVDGEIKNDIENIVNKYMSIFPLTVVRLPKNVGLGNALNEGLKYCRNDLVARADSDDINCFDRFEKQLKCFENNQEISIAGGAIAEFEGSTYDNILCYRILPEKDSEIKCFLKKRNPLNHPTVMFKKSAVEQIGGYFELKFNEDYYLWVRMAENNCVFCNVKDVLVYMRVNSDTFKRRAGYKYFKNQCCIFKYMKRRKLINVIEYLRNISVRFIGQVIVPNRLRRYLFGKMLRRKKCN